MKSSRRNFLGKSMAVTAVTAAVAEPTAIAKDKPAGPAKKVIYPDGKRPEKTPMFSSLVSFGNLLFVAGKGYHQEGDIKVATKGVLDDIQKALESAGSSMEKVLKVSVFLLDLKDFAGMNEVFLGRFGPEPPVRTTVAVAGLPGNSLVEIDVIACIG
jgi:enamine deaminase RidA (YjgF/YER057c/UK114 family)